MWTIKVQWIVLKDFVAYFAETTFVYNKYSQLSLSQPRLSRITALSKWNSGPCFDMEI